MATVNHWDIEEQSSGLYDVTRNRRSFVNELDSEDEAVRKIKRSRFYNSRDTVTLTDKDGYRRTVRMI